MYKNEIGIKSEIIYNILLERGKINFRTIGELTNLKETVISMSLEDFSE